MLSVIMPLNSVEVVAEKKSNVLEDVATVESMATVKVSVDPTVSIPVPPAIVNFSVSKSTLSTPPVSPSKSKSWAVTILSTYALILSELAIVVADTAPNVSSSKNAVPLTAPFKTGFVKPPLPIVMLPVIFTFASALISFVKINLVEEALSVIPEEYKLAIL